MDKEGAKNIPGREGGRQGWGPFSLVLGAMCGHSAHEGLDSSMVAGAYLRLRRKAIGRQM